jgi:hypothetical protein
MYAPNNLVHVSLSRVHEILADVWPAEASGSMPGLSGSALDESKKDKKRREMADRVARFADSRRDE